MLNRIKIIILFMILTMLIVIYLSSLPQQQIENKKPIIVVENTNEYPLTKHISYSYSLTNSSAVNIKKAEFYAYTPIPITPYQRLDNLDSKTPYGFLKDSMNNQIVHFTITNLAPFSTRKIRIKARVAMSHQPNYTDLINPSRYIENTKYLNLDNPMVITLAKKLSDNSLQKTIKNTFDWTMQRIKYNGYDAGEKNVVQTLKSLSGDCTDYMHVFTALTRRNNVPTREIGGYLVKQNKIIHSQDYHNWAEYYEEFYWHIADPQYKNLDQQAGDYIAFKHYGNDPQSPLNNFHRYNITDQRIQISMN
jgi:transglutaminase-like putative cysteine protease